MRRRRVLGLACVALSMLVGVPLVSSAASAQPAATQRVIVVLKDQATDLPATRALVARRESALRSAQAPVISQLSGSGATNVHAYTVLDAVSATVSPSEAAQLKSSPAVSEVVPDQMIQLASPQIGGAATAGKATTPLPGACAPDGKVQLDPQALETIGADSDVPGTPTARSLGITGSGVTVAYIADGLDINNPDFIRANGKHVFVDYKDFSGQGTGVPTGGGEAFLDAGSVAAQGREVYDVSHYSELPLNQPCKIRIEGVAPGASLVGLSIFGAENAAFNSQFLQAIDYAVTNDHVNVLNESLGNNYYPDDQASLDLVKQANDNAIAAGTTVTVSSGDAGVTSTIGTPSTDPQVISAGASTTYRLDAQDGYGGARFPGVTGWLNDNISSFSSSGFEQNGRTVDLVAPGELNWALCSTDIQMYGECTNYAGQASPVQATGGTSESAPLTAGVAALVIQAYELKHGGATPSPALVKQLITSSTDDIGAPADEQGTGRLDAYKAVLAAERYNGGGSPTGTAAKAATGAKSASATNAVKTTGVFSDSETQLNAVDAPGTAVHLSDTLTNESGTTQKVSLNTRQIGAYQSLRTATVTLSDSASPHITDWQGYSDNYEKLQFSVPAGQHRLNASIAFQNASASDLAARVRLTLINPVGKLAAYSVPQGDGNYGNVQVTNPETGTWTAYIFSRGSADGGTTGPVLFGATSAGYTAFGSVSPRRLTLAAGQSAAVNLTVSTPRQPGDSSGAIVVHSAAGGSATAAVTSIPVTLRSLIPAGNQSFTGTLTGGNGRGVITGNEFYYQLHLTAPQAELNASVTLADNPNNEFGAWLVSPSGEALAYTSNSVLTSKGKLQNQIGAQLHVLNAPAGTWTLIVAFLPQVSGTALQEPFTVATDQTPITANGGGLPDSSATQLSAGRSSTYDVAIKNTGTAPESFFVDPRLAGSAALPLTALNSPDTTEPLTVDQNIPLYLIPTETTALTEAASTTGSTPIQFDSGAPSGDPDFASSFGQSVTGSFAANPISQGVWDVAPVDYGAFGTNGAGAEKVRTSASVTTAPFDSTITSSTGDLWSASADPSTLSNFSPVTVNPGQTATIPVTVTPAGTSGTRVRGTLFVDDANFILFSNFEEPNGNEVTAIPYSYTVK